MVFLIIPIAISYFEIRKERRKKERDGTEFVYSLLQWEAKKFKYEWNSWGGDKTNDYLDLARLRLPLAPLGSWNQLEQQSVQISSSSFVRSVLCAHMPGRSCHFVVALRHVSH